MTSLYRSSNEKGSRIDEELVVFSRSLSFVTKSGFGLDSLVLTGFSECVNHYSGAVRITVCATYLLKRVEVFKEHPAGTTLNNGALTYVNQVSSWSQSIDLVVREIVEAEAVAPLTHGGDSTAFSKTGLFQLAAQGKHLGVN